MIPLVLCLLESCRAQIHELCKLFLFFLLLDPFNLFVSFEHFFRKLHLLLLKSLLALIKLSSLAIELFLELVLSLLTRFLLIFKLLITLINGVFVQNVPLVDIL